MISWDGSRFLLDEENLKVFSSDFPSITDVASEAEKAARHVRETGCQIKSAASWLRAWMRRADAAAAVRKRSDPVTQDFIALSRAQNDEKASKAREQWLERHCLNRPPGMDSELYVELLRKEIVYMVRKGALR